jgi:hypothetical protein
MTTIRRTIVQFVAVLVMLVVPGMSGATGDDATELTLRVVDEATREPIAARVYLRGDDGRWLFVEADGAVRYSKQNWINAGSVEHHTCILPGPASVKLMPGGYELTVERGKEYLPHRRRVEMDGVARTVTVPLKRYADLAARGWYSGETHLHRTIDELRTVVLAENLNVAFPLSYWETRAGASPARGNKSSQGAVPDELVEVDAAHVIWPRNTEYEIFTVGERRHTLGALFLLNHRTAFDRGVPPWGPVVEQARREGALFDMDKLDWPFAMTLPVTAEGSLYELANNHLWRTEFAFRRWNSPAPAYLQPPFGATHGNERDWLLYTLGMYYTLLNSGERIVPTAGTASGVHPVPAGFSRVYVKVDGDFSYEKWLDGLRQGRSFVTTGPLLLARLNEKPTGTVLRFDTPAEVPLSCEILSEQPVTFCELIVNGEAAATYRAPSRPLPDGGFRTEVEVPVSVDRSGWIALRTWEDRTDGRFRFAHTAPWWVEVQGSELKLRPEERDYLVQRTEAEIVRSKDVLSAAALAEYDVALKHWQSRPVGGPDDAGSTRRPASDELLAGWLENMLRYHRYTPREVEAVIGRSPHEQHEARRRLGLEDSDAAEFPEDRLVVLPYPGGRHPRTGFLDGARRPQRDTKFSVFLPWARPEHDPPGSRGYVVVDLPEAVFTDLGLTYLAHTHVPTVWSKQGVELPPLEWNATDDGLEMERVLPNGIRFGALVTARREHVEMELWLKNGTDRLLTDIRAQICVMLKGAVGFHDQTNSNKVIEPPFVAACDETGEHWIITAWSPNHRGWANPPVPCLHSDPTLPDCPPGERVSARGRLWFYKGPDVRAEMERLQSLSR